MAHYVKITREHFLDVAAKTKRAEVRRNDRDFWVGDKLWLQEWHNGGYTGNEIRTRITHILPGGQYGVDLDYSVLSIEFEEAFRFPHRDDDGAFSKIVHKDNANCALDLMEKAWRTERDALMVEVKRLRATCAKWNEMDLSREIRVGVARDEAAERRRQAADIGLGL